VILFLFIANYSAIEIKMRSQVAVKLHSLKVIVAVAQNKLEQFCWSLILTFSALSRKQLKAFAHAENPLENATELVDI